LDLTYKSTRESFGDTIIELGANDNNIVAITADLAESLKLTKFRDMFQDRFFDVGVAEQNMMGIAAGMALDGRIPFVASFAVFNPGRNWDQIRVSVAYNNANVKIIGGYVGFSNGKDGATHQALEDIALMRVLPNMVVIDTADYIQTSIAIKAGYNHKGPVYFRIRRDPIQSLESIIKSYIDNSEIGSDSLLIDNIYNFEIGKGNIIKEGRDITLISCGLMLYKAIEAAMILEKKGISTKVINLHTIKPIDSDLLVKAAVETGHVITIEDHQINGGLGSAVSEVLIQNYPVPMKIIGVNDLFGESGTTEELLKIHGLDTDNIVQEAIYLQMNSNNSQFDKHTSS